MRSHPPSSQIRESGAGHAVLLGGVVVVAMVLAAAMIANYAADPGALWRDVHHDRNDHLGFGLDLAVATQALDPLSFLAHLEKARVWPPVHGLALALVFVLGGIDMRLAIVPSLIGWVCTIVLIYMIALRLFADRCTGIMAGMFAVTFAAASPAFRLITADVMLEGLGSALTAFCLYGYLRAAAEPERSRWWTTLAIALTVLFFEKSNYWALTIVPLAVAHLCTDPRGWLTGSRALVATLDPRAIMHRAVRDPLVIAFGVVVLVVMALYARGPTALDLFRQHVSLYPPENLMTAAWAVLFVRLAMLWRDNRVAFDAYATPPGRSLFYWHVVPVAVSFLLPKRIATFLWYVGPTHYAAGVSYNPLHALASQWQAFSQGFHPAPWLAILVLVLVVAAVVHMPRLNPGTRVIFVLPAISALAVILHPQQQWRFQATWLFAVWILAGAGAATVLVGLTRRWHRIVRFGIAAGAIVGLAAAESRYSWTDIAYAAAIVPRSGPRDLELAKAYLPHLRGVHSVGLIATFYRTNFFAWTIQEDCKCKVAVEMPWIMPMQTREDNQRAIADWLAETRAERVVVIDAPGLHPLAQAGLAYEPLAMPVAAIEHRGRFAKIATETVPALGATVTIWQPRLGNAATDAVERLQLSPAPVR
jgi:hypothetical protein